ncbi:MAG: ABC transporter permease [Myxococcales bacterium]|nr:ABC transporter permease [Myxococcales bacterium]
MVTPPPLDLTFDELPQVRGGGTLSGEWSLAWGHLRSRRSEVLLSLVTLLSILGVTAGVATLNWVIGVMTGFELELRDKIVGAKAHIVVTRTDGDLVEVEEVLKRVDGVGGVEASAPYVRGELMVRSAWGGKGAVAKGVHATRTADVTHLLGDLTEGYDPERRGVIDYVDADEAVGRAFLASLTEPFGPLAADGTAAEVTAQDPLLPGIVLGAQLGGHLHVNVGDKVQLIDPMGAVSGAAGRASPNVLTARVAGVFASGAYEYDTSWAYASNEVLQRFLGKADVAGIEIKVTDIDDVARITRDLDAALGPLHRCRHWKSLNAKLFEALALEKWVMGLLLSMIVVNAGLLIVSTLIIVVITKGRQIAILKAMGASPIAIMRVFMMQGCAIGTVGALLGTALGLLGCAFLDQYAYPLDVEVYDLQTLPVVVEPSTVGFIASGAMCICFLATLYPAWRAANLDPVQALRDQ